MFLCNVYFPTRNKEREQITLLHKLRKVLGELNKNNDVIIMGGDFNMIRNIQLDYLGQAKNHGQSRFNQEIDEFLQDFHLLDIWREKHGLKKQFTFTQKNPFMQSRLDYWLVSEEIEEAVIKCEIVPSVAPDHYSVFLCLYDKREEASEKKKGSYWKFNNSLCRNEQYVRQMKEEITKLKTEWQVQIKDKRVLWDFLKMKIRAFTQSFSKKVARERKQKRDNLEREVQELDQILVNGIDEEILDK